MNAQPDSARRIGLARIATIAALCAAPASLGQLCEEQQKLTASDAAPDDWFGDVAIDGNTIVVGARQDDNAGGSNAGAAYVYIRAGPPGSEVWTQQAKLIGANQFTLAENQAGVSVAVSGDTALVGAFLWPAINSATGTAYIFVRSGTPGNEVWTQQAALFPAFGSFQYFGVSVALEGDTALVGSLSAFGLNVGGAAYFFARPPGGTTWTGQHVYPSDGVPGDQFGVAVAMSPSQDTAVVGADLEDNAGGIDAGSAYVFVRSGDSWVEQAKLTASDGAAIDQFGRQIAIDGDTIVVGARLDDHAGGIDAGSAYVFTRNGTVWTQQAKLIASDAEAGAQFGFSPALAGDTVIIGAHNDDHAGGADAGATYVFTRAGTVWTQQSKLTAPDAAAGDAFGGSAALSGDTTVIGAYFDNNAGGSDAGSAYVFECLGIGPTCPADLNGDGTVDAADLAQLLGDWNCAARCVADLDGTAPVNAADLAILLGAWGACGG